MNTSPPTRKAITLSTGFDELEWEAMDFLGWREEKIPSFGYVVAEVDGARVGMQMRHLDGTTRSHPPLLLA